MTGPSNLGGSDSRSQREDWLINTLATVAADLRALRERHDEFAGRTDKNFETTFRKQDFTNGRVRSLEIWRGRMIGAIALLTVFLPGALYVVLPH